MSQRVAACCVAACCSVLRCSVLQRVALQRVAACWLQHRLALQLIGSNAQLRTLTAHSTATAWSFPHLHLDSAHPCHICTGTRRPIGAALPTKHSALSDACADSRPLAIGSIGTPAAEANAPAPVARRGTAALPPPPAASRMEPRPSSSTSRMGLCRRRRRIPPRRPRWPRRRTRPSPTGRRCTLRRRRMD
jgi:hypothetical protein